MPIIVRDTSYELPNANGRNGATGAEIDVVETFFGVDWYELMATLDPGDDENPRPPARPGCTRNRALYAVAWIAMHRVQPDLELAQVMTEYARNEIRFVADTETPGEQARAAAVPTLAGDEGTEPAATS